VAGGSPAPGEAAAPELTSPSPDNHIAVAPVETWKGRSGTGYLTEADARQAVAGRAQRNGALDWRVEADGQGRYAINGYERNPVDDRAHAAATSPLNDLAQPTDAQKDAGNYQKGHVSFQGLNVSIENPVGSDRSGIDKDGTPWSQTMQSHYGYIRGTEGNDGDHVDAFIGPNRASTQAYIIDQVHPSDGRFDEHKVVLGADSPAQAMSIYRSNYAPGWKGAGGVTEMPMPQFKIWVRDGVKSKPLSDLSGVPDGSTAVPAVAGADVARAPERSCWPARR